MKLRKLVVIAAITACIIVYSYSAIKIDVGETFSISIDLEKPFSIIWPCEIAVVGDNGEKGLRIGPNVGRGWLGEAGGQAEYRFFIPENGRYHIWAYCLWFDQCANAVFAQIDDLYKAIIGNNPIYNNWHWVRGFDVELKKGTHRLLLSNHSDHIAIQKVLFASAASQGPDQAGLVFSDIFYDGFDGCDEGNFANWEIINGQWSVLNPGKQTCFMQNALVGKSENKSLILYKNDTWANYSLHLVVKSVVSEGSEAYGSICFGVKSPTQYCQLKWQQVMNTEQVKMEISKKAGTESEELTNFDVHWKANDWNHVEITVIENIIAVKINDTEPIKTVVDIDIVGGIGLFLKGKITAYFDDIHVRKIE